MSLPKLSIITVVYNAEKTLPPTLRSVAEQTYPNIEYIVVDGKSKDGTVDFIKQNQKHIAQWISEPDKGIYDAMNKGLQMATGDFVWFMNGGDVIYAPETAARVMAMPAADVYYGDAALMNERFEEVGLRRHKKLPPTLNWRSFRYGMVVCHQSMIVRRSVSPLYDLNHPYVADIDWAIRVLKQTDKALNTQLILCKFLEGGFSTQHQRRSLTDRYHVLRKHFGWLPNLWNHTQIFASAALQKMQ